MRSTHVMLVLSLFFVAPFLGCGGSEPTTLDVDELDAYVEENADAIAHQDELEGMFEDEDDEDE